MATSQAIGRPNDNRSEQERRHAERIADAQRSGIWCQQLDWFLNASEAALGFRGTTESVISAIERGGASAGGDPDEGMLARVGYMGGRRDVERSRRLARRWHALPARTREVMLAHYLLTRRVHSTVESRFGLLTGVVAWSWLRGGSAGRKPAAKPGSGSVAPPKSTRRQRAEGSLGDALQGLVSACQHGQPGGLAGPAEKLVRDAHALWYGTARAEADRWAEGA